MNWTRYFSQLSWVNRAGNAVSEKLNEVSLIRDRKGMVWDLLLYIPTVFALGTIGLSLYYGGNQPLGYLVSFLACFFTFVGVNRVLGSRLMFLPSSPVALDVRKKSVSLRLRNGERVELIKELRFFSDYAGKSFGLTGMDLTGKKRQYVFHRGQFTGEAIFKDLKSLLAVYR